MNHSELGQLYPIRIFPYNDQWPVWYQEIVIRLRKILGADILLKTEHIGSTAVPGLPSKPTVDILAAVSDKAGSSFIVQQLTDHQWIVMKEQKKHLMFVKGYTEKGLAQKSYHLHIGALSQNWLWDRIYFRDYLTEFPEEKQNYLELKLLLAEKFRNDREAYTDGKEDFVRRITLLAKDYYLNKKKKS